MIDYRYIEKNTPQEAEAKKGEIVGVELKHTTGALTGEPLKQLYDNISLFDAKKLRRIEYLFSTEKAADDNRLLFSNFSNTKPGSVRLFFINDNNQKIQIVL